METSQLIQFGIPGDPGDPSIPAPYGDPTPAQIFFYDPETGIVKKEDGTFVIYDSTPTNVYGENNQPLQKEPCSLCIACFPESGWSNVPDRLIVNAGMQMQVFLKVFLDFTSKKAKKLATFGKKLPLHYQKKEVDALVEYAMFLRERGLKAPDKRDAFIEDMITRIMNDEF